MSLFPGRPSGDIDWEPLEDSHYIVYLVKHAYIFFARTVARSEFDMVPNAEVAHPAGMLGDVWAFVVTGPGAQVRIHVDARDDNDDGASNLDPIAFLLDQAGAMLFGAGGDGVPCTGEPGCGLPVRKLARRFCRLGNTRW
jgi:hypothetical protein